LRVKLWSAPEVDPVSEDDAANTITVRYTLALFSSGSFTVIVNSERLLLIVVKSSSGGQVEHSRLYWILQSAKGTLSSRRIGSYPPETSHGVSTNPDDPGSKGSGRFVALLFHGLKIPFEFVEGLFRAVHSLQRRRGLRTSGCSSTLPHRRFLPPGLSRHSRGRLTGRQSSNVDRLTFGRACGTSGSLCCRHKSG